MLSEQASVALAATPSGKGGAHCLMPQRSQRAAKIGLTPRLRTGQLARRKSAQRRLDRCAMSVIRFALGTVRHSKVRTAAMPAGHGTALTGGIASSLLLSSTAALVLNTRSRTAQAQR